MYGWKKATALRERFVAKNILEEGSHKDFQATESPCRKKCATEHEGPRILDVSLPV